MTSETNKNSKTWRQKMSKKPIMRTVTRAYQARSMERPEEPSEVWNDEEETRRRERERERQRKKER